MQLLKNFRAKFPEYDDLGDDQVIRALGEKHPEYLDDQEFGAAYLRVSGAASLQPVYPGVTSVTATAPDGAERKRMPIDAWASSDAAKALDPGAVEDPAEEEKRLGGLSFISKAWRRGLRQARTAELVMGGAADVEGIARLQRETAALGATEEYQKFTSAKGWKEAFGAWAEAPAQNTAELLAESLGAYLPIAAKKMPAHLAGGMLTGAGVGSVVPGAGTTVGAGLGLRAGLMSGTYVTSYTLETGNKFVEALAEAGVDVKDPESLAGAFRNPEVLARAQSVAVRKGLPIAVFDGLSAGLAGKLISQPAKHLAGKATQVLGEAAFQGLAAGAGETISQVTAGEEPNASAVLAEILGDVAGSGGEVVTGALSEPTAVASATATAAPGGAATAPAARKPTSVGATAPAARKEPEGKPQPVVPATPSGAATTPAAVPVQTSVPAATTPAAAPSPGAGVVLGKGTVVFGANDAKIPAVYAWVPGSEVQASHAGEMFSINAAYAPIKNTRKYHDDQAEQEKVLKGAREFEPYGYTTNVKGASEGPVMVSRGSDGVLRVLGGNGRWQMIQRLSPEKRNAFNEAQDAEAGVFGLPERPSGDHVLVRMLPDTDLATPAGVERANLTVDLLNPSPGLRESTAAMARNDSVKVPVAALRNIGPESRAGELQTWLRGLIEGGVIDRNSRTAILNSEGELRQYASDLQLQAAYRSEPVVEYRNDPKTLETTRAMIDQAAPFAIELRAKGEHVVADAFAELVHRVANFQARNREQKLDDLLRMVHAQGEGFEGPAGALTRNLALALSTKVERLPLNRRGERKIDAEETQRNFAEFFQSLARSVKLAEQVPDLLGVSRSAAEAVVDFLRAHVGDGALVMKEEGEGYQVDPRVVRLNKLVRERGKRKLTVAEERELAELEAALGQSFMAFHREETAKQEDAKRIERMELEARAKKRLVGGQIESQENLFGGPKEEKGEGGQFSLFEPDELGIDARQIEGYLKGQGVGDPARKANEIARNIARLATPENGRVYEGGEQGELFGAAGGGGIDPGAGRLRRDPAPSVGRASPVPGAPADPSLVTRRALGLWTATDFKKAFEQGDTVSSMVAKLATRQIPGFNVNGQVVETAMDVAMMMQSLRSPYFESTKVLILNDRNKVVHSQVLFVGALDQTVVALPDLIQAIEQGRKFTTRPKVILSHNHPSGEVSPSDVDMRVTSKIRAAVNNLGVEWVDHVITNGEEYYSLEHQRKEAIPTRQQTLQAWEVMPRSELQTMADPGMMARLVASLRQSNPDHHLIMYLNTRYRVTAVERVPYDVMRSMAELAKRIVVTASLNGGRSVAIDFAPAQGEVGGYAVSLKRELAHLSAGAIELTDASGVGMPSAQAAGMFYWDRASTPAGEGTLREDEAPYATSGLYADTGPGRKAGKVPVLLGGMKHVRPAEMPEIVRLAKLLTGEVPGIKRLPKALGIFKAMGRGMIKLNPKIFKDSIAAAKTLAHEVGHLTDYLPDRLMQRGNLFGRIGTLRHFLATTFPLKSTQGLETIITPDDRATLRRKAERTVGARPPKDEEADLAAWRKEVSRVYRELLDEEIERRGLTKLEVVAGELVGLTQYWKPIPDDASKSYLEYRLSSPELYGDAVSVLLNSPGLLEEMCPVFYDLFWEYLDRKPAVKQALFELQDLLNQGKVPVLERRREDIQAMFAQGEEIMRRKADERELRRKSWKGYWLQLKQQLADVYEPITARARSAEAAGATWPAALDPRNILESGLMVDNTNMRFVRRIHEGVLQPIEELGMGVEQLGEYLLMRRIQTQRRDIANPLGLTPEAARDGLLKIRLDLGIERMTRLETAVQKFHDLVFEAVETAVDVGSYSRETFDTVLAPNKDVYAAFAVLDYLEDYVPATIRQQVGTLKDIANPFTATVLKTITLNNLNTLQRSKNATRDLLQRYFPAEIERGEGKFLAPPNIRSAPPAKPDTGLLEVLEDGRKAWYYVDPLIAHAFERLSPQGLHKVTRVLDTVFRKGFYRAYITYSPSFLMFNPMRDFYRAWYNLPLGVGPLKLAGAYARTFGSAVSQVRGMPDGLATEMMANYAIGAPHDTLTKGFRDDQFGDLLRRFHLLPEKAQGGFFETAIGRPIRAVGRAMEFFGSLQETLPKMAAYKLMRERGYAPREASAHVRNYAGTPNIFKRGRQVNVVRAFFPFYNVFLQGWRSDLQKMNPKSASGWLFKWAAMDGVLAVVMGLASAGLLGVALRELFGGVSEYDKTNYNVIPVGWTAGGDFGKKVRYIRIPRSESSRLLSGLTYKMTRLLAGDSPEEWTELLDFGAGQMPSVNPAVTLPAAWMEYFQGENPEDPFRGRPIIPRTEFDAGGWDSLKPMFLWTWEQSGGGSFLRWDPRAESTTELVLSAVPGVNRLFKTSDYGYREEQMAAGREEDQARARHRLAMPDNARQLLTEYMYLRGVDVTRRTVAQVERYELLNVWYNSFYRPMDEDVTLLEDAKQADAADKMRAALGEVSKGFERPGR